VTDSSETGADTSQTGRRDAIKKGVVAATTAGLVWNAPTVRGLSLRPVYAAAQSGGPIPAGGDLVNDNCQDGQFLNFNLQVRNTTNMPLLWETIWRDRPYSTIPNLNLPPGVTYSVIPTAGGFDHVFTATTPLGPFQGVLLSGGQLSPVGDDDCDQVDNFVFE